MSAPPPPHSVSVTPDPDESLISYMFRLAARRHLGDAHDLARECGFDRLSNRPEPEWLEALAALAQVDSDVLDDISFGPPDKMVGWYRFAEMPSSMFDRTWPADRRVCPECLAEKPIHRAMWDIKCISACPVHLKLLIDVCQACKKPLRWRGRDLTRCECLRGDLTRMVSASITEDEARGTRTVYGLLGDKAFLVDAGYAWELTPFQKQDESFIIEFLCRAGMSYLPGRKKQFSMNCPGKFSAQFHTVLSEGLMLAELWPQEFYGLLDDIGSDTTAKIYQPLFGSVGAVERWLARLPDKSGKAVRTACRRYRKKAELAVARARDLRRKERAALAASKKRRKPVSN